MRLHDLRHRAAVAWLSAGSTSRRCRAGWATRSPTITLNVYGGWVPETVENPLPEPVARDVVVPLRGTFADRQPPAITIYTCPLLTSLRVAWPTR